jgi:hypothetical protein
MSSCSRFRPDRRAALFAASLLTASCMLTAATGAEEQLEIVAVVASADRQVSLVAELPPTVATPIRSEDFSVTAGEVELPTRAVPVISDQTVIGVIVDASAADVTAQQAGLSGAANFLLQMPLTARAAVVADTSPPTVLAPLQTGATDALRALSGVKARGEQATSDALSLVLRHLPDSPGRLRLVVLYTSAPHAGGEVAADLAERLTQAHALLAVVSTATDTRYWSRLTAATGGVLVAAEPADVMAAFDYVAAALRSRYVVSFWALGELPTRVSVQVNTVKGTLTADTVVTPRLDVIGRGEQSRSATEERGAGGVNRLWLVVPGLGVVIVIAAAVLLAVRGARPHDATGPDVTPERMEMLLGGATVPDQTTGTQAGPSPPNDGRKAAVESEEGAASAAGPKGGGRTVKSQAASAAAAVAAAEQRGRAVAAAARLAAEAASSPHIRRRPSSE